MIICICGSRSIKDPGYIPQALKAAEKRFPEQPLTEIVTGGAEGVDQMADAWAKENGYDRTVMYANWKKHGRAGGYHRNERMVRYADVVLAIWDGKSKGTQHTITIAEGRNKPVFVFNISEVPF